MDGFIFPAPFAGIVSLIAMLGLGYVWLGCRCEDVGREIKKLEIAREALNKKYLNEEYRWTRMKSPRNLEEALERHGIVMCWPVGRQLVRLRDPGVIEDSLREVERDVLRLAKLAPPVGYR